MASTAETVCATAMNGRATVAIMYPATMSGLRVASLSDHQPLAILSRLAVDSATPSISPTKAMLAPSVAVRNTGSSG